ncbi:hypothetical protein QCA50_003924 [Cerrena zonata]|uniref:CxC2-like cysteine cluster KDZ transposase-associated domain-containing protein n=1 Tax=Cerrena zonata TaxID=2478898 RepID=A0AAW0GMD1_9APHY
MSKRVRNSVHNALYGNTSKRAKTGSGSSIPSARQPASSTPIIVEDLTLRRKKKQVPKGRLFTTDASGSGGAHADGHRPATLSSDPPGPSLSHLEHYQDVDDEAAAQFQGLVFEQLVEPPRERKDTASYLNSWLPQRDLFLSEIVEREAPPHSLTCDLCDLPLKWRCLDCFGEPAYCTSCCRLAHGRSPLHRISRWNGKTFYRSALYKTGLTLFMGHRGLPCPSVLDIHASSAGTTPASSAHPTPLTSPQQPSTSLPHPEYAADHDTFDSRIARYMDMLDDGADENIFDQFDLTSFNASAPSPFPPSSPLASPPCSSPSELLTPLDTHFRDLNNESSQSVSPHSDDEVDCLLGDDDSADEVMDFETAGITTSSLRYPKGLDSAGNTWMTIIDITGVHHLPIHFCKCEHDTPRHIQLLRMALYPASYDRPQTVFTFRVLDDFDLENLETKAAAQRYFAKLRRLTCNAFPQTVPDRYREMLRIMREWRNLKQRQRAGLFGKDLGKEVAPGRLALFCPACPQPGINLPDNWKEDRDDWKYMSTLLGDGNFKQEHLKMKYPEQDIALSDGHGYMVGKAGFDEYMKVAPNPGKAAMTCNEHDAVKSQNSTRAHLDATGIGAVACGRHGCFVPHSVVNFQKGEGYRYMDYAFLNALNYISFLLLFMLMYDIMCQWFPNFFARIQVQAVSELIKIRDDIVIKRAIGLFHVHGHVKECYPRYASTFIRGAGIVDGEIIETLWHVLNDTASSARAMSWYHRQEYIDCHMGDSNWKKLTRMVPTLLRKWYACLDQSQDSEEYYAQLSQHVGPTRVAQWTQEEDRMQAERGSDVTVMDGLDVAEEHAPGKSAVQQDLADAEPELNIPLGSSAWIALGLKLEEIQLELLNQVRRMDARASYDRQLSLQAKRRRLQNKIDSFITQSSNFIGHTDEIPQTIIDSEWSNEDDEDDDPVDAGVHSTEDVPHCEPVLPELIPLPLPSSFSRDERLGRLHYLTDCELKLRAGQANDALHNLRIAIAHKSFVFRSRIRKNATTNGYTMRLRSYGDAHAVQMTIDQAAKVYRTARKAMVLLGASSTMLSNYQVLLKEDLVSSTAVADPNARGQSRNKLSWIWRTTSHADNPVFLDEMLRVNWLRAKSRRDRWKEEKVLLRSEMSWTEQYFTYNMNLWIERSKGTSAGAQCYALKEAVTWQRFAHLAQKALAKIAATSCT